MIPLVLGTLLALAALAYVLAPLFTDVNPARGSSHADVATTAAFAAVCSSCGPRPERDAIYCSNCGKYLGGPCAKCGAVLEEAGARFCARCGHSVAA